MYKAIIFDFFDVIRTDALKHWYKKYGYEHKEEFIALNQQLDRGTITVDTFLEQLGEMIGRSANDIFEEMEAETSVDYEVVAIAKQLRDHYMVGLLSNAEAGFLRNLLREHDLERYFDEIIISSEVGFTKPSPEIFLLILERMKIRPSQAVFIDDNPKNVAAAKALGLETLLFTNANTLAADLRQLDVILT